MQLHLGLFPEESLPSKWPLKSINRCINKYYAECARASKPHLNDIHREWMFIAVNTWFLNAQMRP